VGVDEGAQAPRVGAAWGGYLRGLRKVAALQPISEFGRVYAAYGGVFIALALVWGVLVDGFGPDRWDLLGAALCVAGVVVMVAPPRG
jgi:small multidrug resistance family-3 protein